MAEALGVASSVLQLMTAVRELRAMVKAVRDVPKDLKNTLDDIENFEEIIAPMITSMQAVSPNTNNERALALVSGHSAFHALKASHRRYEEATSAVKILTDNLTKHVNGKSHLKHLYQLKAVFRKEELTELKEMMESARRSLDLAISYYNTSLIMAQLENLRLSVAKQEAALSAVTATTLVTEQDSAHIKMKRTKRRAIQHLEPYQNELCGLRRCYCDCHHTTSLRPWFWPVTISSPSSWKPCSKASCRNSKNASVWISFTKIGIRLAVSLSLDVMISSQESYIRPSLSVQRVVRRTSPGFTILYELQIGQRRDWSEAKKDLLELFETGKASPRDVDPDGMTWLEKLFEAPWRKCNAHVQVSMFNMLAHMGTQINTSRLFYSSIEWIGEVPHFDLLDNLIRLQLDPSDIEPLSFTSWPRPCSPLWYELSTHPDPFFLGWISKNLAVYPGFSGINPLMEAILIGTKDEVARLLHRFPINDQENTLGLSALHLAVSRPQHLEIVLESGADVNARDRNGITPLMYAAATGQSKEAIKLLEAGADPDLRDTYHNRYFIQFATDRRNWDTVLEILKYIRRLNGTSKDCRPLLSHMLVIWSYYSTGVNDFKYLCQLLEWGADPNIIYDNQFNKTNSETLAHRTYNIEELRILISHRFTNFNHVDSFGSHALFSVSRHAYRKGCPDIIGALLDGGSDINLQNNSGHAALHAVSKSMKMNLLFRPGSKFENWKISALNSAEILLHREADPLIEDHCDCYCSLSGCTPSHVLIKEIGILQSHIWALDFLDIVRATTESETTRRCLLHMLRVFKFEELELTHTCCRTRPALQYHSHMLEDDIQEIQEEEKELAELLDQEMQTIEDSLGDDYDEALICAILRVTEPEEMDGSNADASYEEEYKFREFHIDHWRDTFERHGPSFNGAKGLMTELPLYENWVEHEQSVNQKIGKPDDKWYERRKGWILRLKEGMNMKGRASTNQ